MLRFVIGALGMLLALSVQAGQLKLDSLKVGSRVYKTVTVLGYNTTDLYFTHSQGMANARLKYLDRSLQERFNYDPQEAERVERVQEADDARYTADLASNYVARINARTAKAALEAKHASITSEDNLADPISEQSLLGKPVTIEVERWLGDKPEMQGKFVMVAFWAPWSIPCRKWIPELNALQKKFAPKLAVVALTSEPQSEIEEMPGERIQCACAIDSKNRLGLTAGITSVPSILFLDPKGIVRYQGHPGTLTQEKLQSMLAKPPPE